MSRLFVLTFVSLVVSANLISSQELPAKYKEFNEILINELGDQKSGQEYLEAARSSLNTRLRELSQDVPELHRVLVDEGLPCTKVGIRVLETVSSQANMKIIGGCIAELPIQKMIEALVDEQVEKCVPVYERQIISKANKIVEPADSIPIRVLTHNLADNMGYRSQFFFKFDYSDAFPQFLKQVESTGSVSLIAEQFRKTFAYYGNKKESEYLLGNDALHAEEIATKMVAKVFAGCKKYNTEMSELMNHIEFYSKVMKHPELFNYNYVSDYWAESKICQALIRRDQAQIAAEIVKQAVAGPMPPRSVWAD